MTLNETHEINQPDDALEIIYRDEWLIAINKPAGLLVHRSMIDRHERRFAMQMLRDQIGQHVYPIHRLDKPTSGLLLFALSSDIARNMGEQFSDRTTRKTYLAVVRGYTAEADRIDYPLKEELDKKSDTKADRNKEAQAAVTSYRRLATVELPYAVGRYQTARYSLVELIPETGRKHQLRRHMKHIFHPIVGDTTHGDGKQNQLFRDHFNCHRLLLASTSLAFTHPVSQVQMLLRADPGPEFNSIIERFGWEDMYPPHQ